MVTVLWALHLPNIQDLLQLRKKNILPAVWLSVLVSQPKLPNPASYEWF